MAVPDDSRDLLFAVGGALVVHLAAAMLAVSTLSLPVADVPMTEPAQEIIEAEVIDARVLEAEARRVREAAAAEQRARDQAAAEVEQQRIASARVAAEAEAAERRLREAALAKARVEAARQKREAEAQAQREKELKAQLTAEERRRKAEQAGLLAPYKQAIAQKVMRNWIKPASATAGIECLVRVEQLPTGDVVRARVVSCNGDEIVRRSIEDAVLKASPLPPPPERSLYERTLEFVFKPVK